MAGFKVLRPFRIDGRVAQPGETIEVADSWLMRELLAARRIEPTPDAIAQIRSHSFMVQWTEPRTQAITPRSPGLGFRN